MPKLPPKPCTHPGCKAYAVKRGRCADHQPVGWKGKGTGSSRGYGWAWGRLRDKILERDGYVCQDRRACNGLTRATDVDHILPKAQGGTDSPDNLRAICPACHKEKTRLEALRGRGEVEK